MLDLRLLGPVRIERGGQPVRGFPTRAALALLCYLASRGQPLTRSHLVDLFWPRKDEAQGRASLSRALHSVTSLVPGCLAADRHTVAWQPSVDVALDTQTFQALAATGSARALAAAVELYRDEFLTDIVLNDCPDFDLWLVHERQVWRQRLAGVLERLIDLYTRQGEYTRGLDYARRLVDLEPWHEEAHRHVMRLLGLSGQRSAALAQYEVCRRALRAELGVEPGHETRILYEQLKTSSHVEAASPPPTLPLLPPPHLPISLTPLFGREAEMTRLRRRLLDDRYRLLTLVGPGGVGKTRLALAAAEGAAAHFPDGVWFVSLAEADTFVRDDSPDSWVETVLAAVIARTLGATFSGHEESRVQALTFLRHRRALLVLDSFEYLQRAAGLVLDILRNAPQVTLLVTAREPLQFQAEYVIRVEGLPVPPVQVGDAIDAYASVQLFVERADRTPNGFQLDEATRPAVAHICRLVGGMPLALELAASLTADLSCDDVVRAIQRDADILATSQRDVPDRHRSLRVVFESSWQSLSGRQQAALAQVAVFLGGFSAEAAAVVAHADAIDLRGLVEKTLLQHDETDRYSLHDLVRQFALDKLQTLIERGILDSSIYQRHSDLFLDLLARHGPCLGSDQTARRLAELRREFDNLCQAWYWAASQGRTVALARLARPLALLFMFGGLYHEGEVAFALAAGKAREAVAVNPSPAQHQALGVFLAEQALFLSERARYAEALALADDVISQAREARDEALEALGWLHGGRALWSRGELEAGRRHLEQALERARAVECADLIADSLRNLGIVAWLEGAYALAQDYLSEARATYADRGELWGEARARNNLGLVATARGEYAAAHEHYRVAQRLYQRLGERAGESIVLHNLGHVYERQGDLLAARRCYEQALATFQTLGLYRVEASALNALGRIALRQGQVDAARRILHAALVRQEERGDRIGQAACLALLGELALCLMDPGRGVEYSQSAQNLAEELGHRPLLAEALTGSGRALFELGRLAEAADAFDRALGLYNELHQPHLAVQPLIGRARVALAVGDADQARRLVEPVVACLTRQDLQGSEAPLLYLGLYQVLDALGDPHAQGCLDRAQELLIGQAAQLEEDAARAAFWRLSWHAQIQAEYERSVLCRPDAADEAEHRVAPPS